LGTGGGSASLDAIGPSGIRRSCDYATFVGAPCHHKGFAGEGGITALFDRTKKCVEVYVHDGTHHASFGFKLFFIKLAHMC
jgi:hypothetical protein